MFQNYLKIAWRNLQKRRLYSLVNLIGLAAGITFTLLIGSYVWTQLRVNATLRNADNQYILQSTWKQPGMGYEDVTVAPLAKTLKERYPSLVANYYRFDVVTVAISNGNKHFIREVAQAGDSTMMLMFGFSMLQGDARTALSRPNSIVITQENALKYFGRTDVLGRTLSLSNYVGGKQNFTVTGILKSLPKNSVTYLWDLPVNVFIPFNSLAGRTEADNWRTVNIANYLELNEGVHPDDLIKLIEKLLATNTSQDINKNLKVSLTPLIDYYRAFNKGIVTKTIYTLSGIAVFILLMAIVNFVNITSSTAISRIREIGVRKALGVLRKQLIYQFLTESIILAILAFTLSLVFYELFRSSFAEIVGGQIDSLWTISHIFLAAAFLLAILIGSIAGFYPAFALSALSTVDSLKGKMKSVKAGLLLRRSLITVQFMIALLVFCGTLIIRQQVAYFFTKDVGFSKESIMLVSLPRDWTPQGVARMETVRNELARLADVSNISISSSTLKGGASYTINLYPADKDSTQATPTFVIQADEHFTETYQVPMLSGQFYSSSQRIHQEDKLVLNETAVRALGYKSSADAIGQQVYSQGYGKPITIIGVTSDFSFHSMKESIQPTAISHVNGAGNLFSYLSIKLHSNNLPRSIASIEQQFHRLLPDAPFEFSFTDEALQQLYQAELQLKKAAQIATLLALIIVLCGTVGMVSLSIVRRTRELAIRKVLGASVERIMLLFMQEFLLALVLALLIAFPLAYLLMQQWLQTFAYHIDINLLSFAGVAGMFALSISLVVGLQTIKAALMNPVKNLRTE